MVKRLNREIVKCRAFMHAMDEDILPPSNIRQIHVFQQWTRCIRCGSHRVQSLRADMFTVINTRYTYSDRYSAEYREMTMQEAKRWLVEHPVAKEAKSNVAS